MKNYIIFIGRFNPIHIGHLNTIKYISDEARSKDAVAYIGLTNTHDSKDNPLTFKSKLKYTELAIRPYDNVNVYQQPIYTIYEFVRDICFECDKQGGGTVYFYAGSDRVPNYTKLCDQLLKKYQGRNELLNVTIEVVEAVVRGSKTSYSATKMRQHVRDGNLEEFIAHCPFGSKSDNEKYGNEMFNEITAEYSGKTDNSPQHNITSASDTYETVKKISQTVSKNINQASGKPDRLYVVGGAVRDEILGKKVNDFDLVTTMDYRKYAEIFNTEDVRFRGKNVIVVPVIDGEPFETACLGRGATIEDRLHMSDLTMNAMAKDVETGKIIDPTGGQTDLSKKQINLTDFMKQAFPEGKQPVAVMRCLRFASVFGWNMTPDSKAAIIAFSKRTKGKLKITQAQFDKDWQKIKKAHVEDVAIALFKEVGLYDNLVQQFGSQMNESKSFMTFVEFLREG